MDRTRTWAAAGLLFTLILLASCGGGEADTGQAAVVLPTKTLMAPQQSAAYPAEAAAEAVPETNPAEDAGPSSGLRTFVVLQEQSSASYLADEEFLEDALSKLGIMAGEVDVVGTTEIVSGQIMIDPTAGGSALGETFFTADLSALKTDQDRRDNWIQEDGPRFSLSPQATFSATSIEGLDADYQDGETAEFRLAGDLTILNVTQPVVFDVVAAINGDTLAGTAETRLRMSDFGIEPPSFARTLSVADEFGIRVNIVATEHS